MRYVLIMLVCGLLASCVGANVHQETILPDGSKDVCDAKYNSFWRDVTAADLAACGAKGKSDYSEKSDMSQLIQLLSGLMAPGK